ncbi:uncharacterized protein VP01_14195g1, partial [Puccinia sorghi]
QARQLKASGMADPPPSPPLTSAPTTNPNAIARVTTDPNAMDLLAFQCGPHRRLSDAEQASQVKLNLCFCCGQAGNVSHGCSNGRRKSQEKINGIGANHSTIKPAPTPENAILSKNVAQV